MLNDSSKHNTPHKKDVEQTPHDEGAENRNSLTAATQTIGRHASVPWGPIASTLWAVVIYVVPLAITGSLLSIYPLLMHWNSQRTTNWLNNSISAQFIYTVIVEALAISIVWLLLRHYRTKPSAIGLKRAKLMDALYAIIAFAAYLVMYLVIVAVLEHLIPSLNTGQQQDVGFQNATATGSLVMAFISLVILPPIAEETIFRGFVFTGFRRKFGFALSAIGTSLLFAIPHLFESAGAGLLWIAGVDTFILSCVLCFVREKTGRLWAGMGVHALKNGLAFATIFIFHLH